jgi:hypothetical protein
MILDAQNQFADSQALTASAASTNIIDLGADRNIGIGEPMSIVINVEVALDDGNADETYTIQAQADDNSSFSSALPVGGLVTATRGDAAGTQYVIPLPADYATEQYLRVYFTLGGTTPTGTVSAYLQPSSMIANSEFGGYASGYTIS